MLMAKIDADETAIVQAVDLAGHLDAEVGGLEATFRAVGETLAASIGTIDQMARGLEDIQRSMAPETAGLAVSRLRQAAHRLSTLPLIQQRRAIEIETLTGRARELSALLADVSAILHLLGIYGMNIKIASSGEASFFDFVVGMESKLASGSREVRHIERELEQFGRVVGDVRKADRMLAQECARVGATAPADLTRNANALQAHVETVLQIAGDTGGIMRTVQGEVARILGAIQIGDSVRQRVEHCVAILRRVAPGSTDPAVPAVPPGAAAHMVRLVAAQLDTIGGDFATEVGAVIDSLNRLGPLADQLLRLLESHAGGEDAQILTRLESDIAKLDDVTQQLSQADRQLASLTGFVTRTLADLTQGLGRIQRIAVDVQDISTNTRLLCRRHGVIGNAVAVIAKEVAPCASQLDTLSTNVARLIGALAAIDLVQDGSGVDSALILDEALAVVHGACESANAAVAKGGEDARRIVVSLVSSAGDLEKQRSFAETLALGARTLALHAEGLAPGSSAAALPGEVDETALRELLPWAAGLYTMAREREVHALFLLPGMTRPPVATVTFDEDDDGLF
ncbi:chemotaxis protein [Sphingomonas metalli]|uniref:Chemotaxis protein n=1 Tax=Sphingomonas metalli TaxID=1779358 RepID=A0A916WTH6_9SPHN|nr:hypothetical protein [Sphingomonas metalli]GGB28342.1 chemotaxis protein [Sphingomonas metalli]